MCTKKLYRQHLMPMAQVPTKELTAHAALCSEHRPKPHHIHIQVARTKKQTNKVKCQQFFPSKNRQEMHHQ